MIPIVQSFRVDLRAEHDTVFPAWPGEAFHGALHRTIERISPAAQDQLKRATVKPLSCTPLYYSRNDGRLVPVTRKVLAGQSVWIQIAVLDSVWMPIVMAAFETLRWRPLPMVIERPFRVLSVCMDAPTSSLPSSVPYEELLATATPAEEIVLNFLSPTYVRSSSAVQLGLPARQVFEGYYRRWTAFGGPQLPGLDDDWPAAVIDQHQAAAGDVFEFKIFGHRERGYVGTTTFGLSGSRDLRRSVAALATYAQYCGTGSRTLAGMGHTERLE